MALKNIDALNALWAALAAGRTITVQCPNGDKVTASYGKFLRWGRSRWAEPCGKEYHGDVASLVVQHCGRGAAMRACQP